LILRDYLIPAGPKWLQVVDNKSLEAKKYSSEAKNKLNIADSK